MVQMLPLVVSCLLLSWVSLFVRFYVKIFMIGETRWDDWILLGAVILFSGQCSCVLVMIDAAAKHSTIGLDAIPDMLLASYNLSILTSVCIKTSFALSLNRCFSTRWQRLLITNVTLAFYAYTIAKLFLDLFFCGRPYDMAHKESLEQCELWPNMLPWWLFGGIFNAVVTWVYILLPAVVIWTSGLSLKVKASVSVITVVGILSGLAAIFRILASGSFTNMVYFDPTNRHLTACIVLEMAFGIIATSMTNSTRLPKLLARIKVHNDVQATDVGGNTIFEGNNTDFIKLSPIICPQNYASGDNWGSAQVSKRDFASKQEIFALPTSATMSNHFPWSDTPGALETMSPSPARLTLIIDDISDDEDDFNAYKGSQGIKREFTNV